VLALNYAAIKKTDVANGPGVRVSLYVSGCRHHCKGCFNQETWDFAYGNPFGQKQAEEILEALEPSYIRGFSLLGGEPFEPENQLVLVGLLRHIRERYPKKTIWCYSGYLLDSQILSGKLGDPEVTREMLGYIDILVDGEFVEAEKDINLRFKGSRNQRIINVPESLKEGKVVLWGGQEYA
jgi:anaerobic ribonucleoside-triphosphate reductase activating protein